MKKILWVVNPLDFRESDCEFPLYVAEVTGGEVSVAFLDTGIFESIPVFTDNPVFPTREYRIEAYPARVNEDKLQIAESTHTLIRAFFTARNMPVRFHEDEGLTYEQLITESRYSDLLLCNIAASFFGGRESHLSGLVKDLLAKAQCPVLIVPDELQEIHRIFFTYNGSYSSVYAIRQFTYLFENTKDIPVTVLEVIESGDKDDIANKQLLTDFLSRHYSKFSFKLLHGRPDNELMLELMYQRNAIVTFGAFSRNRVSRMIHRSDSEKLTESVNMPVFITHP